MSRIEPLSHAAATGDAKTLLDGVQAGLGMVPNIFATFAHAPKVLEGFLALNKTLGQGLLPADLREQIALTVAGANECDYCASAHTALGRGVGLDSAELGRNLQGRSENPRTQVVLDFVHKLVLARGQVADADVQGLRIAGFSDGEIVEIVTHTAVNLFTNYFNHVAGTEIDFPVVRAAA